MANADGDVWRVTGSENLTGSDWSLTDDNNIMTLTNGIYYWEKALTPATETYYEFKVTKNGSWDGAMPSSNYGWTLPAGSYNAVIAFNGNNDPYAIGSVALKGSWDSWAGELPLTRTSGLTYTGEYTIDTANPELKLVTDKGNYFGRDELNLDGAQLSTKTGGNSNIFLDNSTYTTYRITASYDLSKKKWTLKMEPKYTYSVTFVNGKKWENVSAYVWNETGGVVVITDPYPGNSLGDPTGTRTINGESLDVYTYTLETYDPAPEKIIFNNNKSGEGEEKTGDLAFENGKQYTDAVTFVPVYAVVGSNEGDTDKAIFSGKWDAANTTDIMTKPDDIWTISFNNVNLTDPIEFKVIKKAYLEATEAEAWYPDGDNLKIPVTGEPINIKITFDDNTTTVSFTYTPTSGKETFTVGTDGWATAKATYAVDFTGVEGIEAYTATVSENTVTLHKVGAVPAETALVLKGKTKEVPTIESADAVSNDLHWYTTYTVNDEHRHVYGLVKGTDGKAQFTRVNNAQVITNKAILELAPSASRELKVVFDDETTGISQIENTQPATKTDGAIYNLNGQRVMNPSKGLYIVNGKKVIMK